MKHLLLILLFVPFISFGQDMTYEDLMSFEEVLGQIDRFLIERNYDRFDKDNNDSTINYGYNFLLHRDWSISSEYKGARISL